MAIPIPDPDPGKSGFVTARDVMIPGPDPDPKLESYPFGDSNSKSRKKWNCKTSSGHTKRVDSDGVT